MRHWHSVHRRRFGLIGMLVALLGLSAAACQVDTSPGTPITVGLIAPLSGGSAAGGEAIQRGMLLAIEEVNRAGGVLGRQLALAVRDVPNDPAAGVVARGSWCSNMGSRPYSGAASAPSCWRSSMRFTTATSS